MKKFKAGSYKGNVVMSCDTPNKALKCCEVINKKRVKEGFKPMFFSKKAWFKYRELTCIETNGGGFSDYSFYSRRGFSILNFDDFSWEA